MFYPSPEIDAADRVEDAAALSHQAMPEPAADQAIPDAQQSPIPAKLAAGTILLGNEMGNADGHHGKRALKEVSVQQLETAIAAALYKITAHRYDVDIKRFDLDLGVDSVLRDGAVIEMRVTDSGNATVPGRSSLDLALSPGRNAQEPGLSNQAPGFHQDNVKV